MKSIVRNHELILVYVTTPDRSTARRLARALVDERLAACANIWGTIESVYRWKGKVDKGREIAVVIKTRRALLSRLTRRVKELHPYETPCVIAFPITGGNAEFLQWLREETSAR